MVDTTTPEERLAALGFELPAPVPPLYNYVPCRKVGNLLFLSGQGPREPDGNYRVGKVGSDISVERAYEDARLTGLHLIAATKAAISDLCRVRSVIKMFGMVNAAPEFDAHPKVINGCSDLLVAVFGDAGRHARSAVGMGSLPNGMTVEIELVLEVD